MKRRERVTVRRGNVGMLWIQGAAWCAMVFPSLAATTNHVAGSTFVGMKEIVVTATRETRDPWRTPASVAVLDGETLRLGLASRTIPEAIEHEPGVMVQKTGHGQGSPYIRGFTGFRNLMLIDGVRLNNSVFRDGPNQYWNTVDPLSLSRLELVSGPSSVLYGSDAIGGTVNAITRGAQDLRLDSEWDTRLYYRYASAEDSHVARVETIGALTDELFLSGGYSYKDFGDLEGGRDVGTQRKTGYDERGWNAKLEYFPDADTAVTLAHQRVDIDDAWRTHKTIYGIDWEGLSVGSELRRSFDQDRQLTYLRVHRENLNGLIDAIEACASYHVQEEEQYRVRTEDRYDVQGFEVGTIGATLQMKSDSVVGDWTYGVDYYRDSVDSFSRNLNVDGSVKSESIQGPVGDDSTYDTLGAYVQDQVDLNDRLSLVLGGRYEYAEADANKVQDPETGDLRSVSGNWDSVVGSARALYALDHEKTCHVFASVSQGFRAPNLSDLTRYDTARTDEIETPTPDLDPERFVEYELGLKAHTRRLDVQMTCFYTDIKDMIVRTPTGRTIDGYADVTKKNGGDGHVGGVEFAADWRMAADWSVFGQFTWMDGKVETYPTSDPELVEEPLDRLMPPTGRVGLKWGNDRLWAEIGVTVAADADKLSTSDKADTSRIPEGGTPGYTVCDLRAGWRVNRDLALSAGIENVTDEDYRIHGSGLNEPGRNVVLAAEYTF